MPGSAWVPSTETLTGLPVGITLVGDRNQDDLLLQVARAYERATNARLPPRLVI